MHIYGKTFCLVYLYFQFLHHYLYLKQSGCPDFVQANITLLHVGFCPFTYTVTKL